MDPGIPVPPIQYGGHERLVYMFAKEYNRLGHEVSLLAGPDSNIDGTVYRFGVNNLNRSGLQRKKEVLQAWQFLRKHRNDFDLIHNFGRLIYLLPVLNSPVKKIMSYGRPVSARGIRTITRLPNRNLIFTACSNYCVSTGNVTGIWKTVYNAIDFSQYHLKEQVDNQAPFMFLGRLDRIKGAHTAIKIAKLTGNRLILAGNVSHTADNYDYFKKEVEPYIDNEQIIYTGALNDAEKDKYLGQTKALLFPIEWNEPFGMVMVEAMACGTPVLAFNKGSVPEVIENGITGFVVNNETEMFNKVIDLNKIDRKICRQAAERRFSAERIAKEYLSLFDDTESN